MLSGESAYGDYPYRALAVQSTVSMSTEAAMAKFSVSWRPRAWPKF